MTFPTEPVSVPEKVRLLAHGADLVCVWDNDYGGLTFRATGAGDPFFIKWGPRNLEFTLRDEAERMTWASRWITVPTVLDQGQDETHEWLVTAAIDGLSAVDPRWVAEPAVAVRAVGEALRAMHDMLPVEKCPWGVERAVPPRERRAARHRGARGVPHAAGDRPSRGQPWRRLLPEHADRR